MDKNKKKEKLLQQKFVLHGRSVLYQSFACWYRFKLLRKSFFFPLTVQNQSYLCRLLCPSSEQSVLSRLLGVFFAESLQSLMTCEQEWCAAGKSTLQANVELRLLGGRKKDGVVTNSTNVQYPSITTEGAFTLRYEFRVPIRRLNT